MTIKECIDIVDNSKPNTHSIEEKVMWLSFIDEIIINDVLKTHEGYDGRYDTFEGYSPDKTSVALIVQSPYDRLYPAYIKMKIDGENGETARYNNSAALFNSYMMEFRKYYNKTHMPLSGDAPKPPIKKGRPSDGLSEQEYENLKRDLYYLLSEDQAEKLSQDKIYDVIMSYVNNNIQMLRGLDGKDGEKGDKGDKGEKGEKGDPFTYDNFTPKQLADIVESVKKEINTPAAKIGYVELPSSGWIGEASLYSQVVAIEGVTERSQVDLTPDVNQLAIFYEKDLTFVTENDGGIVTVYAIGQKPQNDYTIQVTITETERVSIDV
jgi:hypothetical protein